MNGTDIHTTENTYSMTLTYNSNTQLLPTNNYSSYTNTYTYLPLRSLMPGKAQQADLDDRSLDQSFRADKIEFVLVSRIATPDESLRKQQIIDVNLAEWVIPTEQEFNDAMGLVIDKYTETDISLIHTICLSLIHI